MRRDALATAGLADDAERLALPHREADVADGMHRATVRAEAHGEVFDRQQRLGR